MFGLGSDSVALPALVLSLLALLVAGLAEWRARRADEREKRADEREARADARDAAEARAELRKEFEELRLELIRVSTQCTLAAIEFQQLEPGLRAEAAAIFADPSKAAKEALADGPKDLGEFIKLPSARRIQEQDPALLEKTLDSLRQVLMGTAGRLQTLLVFTAMARGKQR